MIPLERQPGWWVRFRYAGSLRWQLWRRLRPGHAMPSWLHDHFVVRGWRRTETGNEEWAFSGLTPLAWRHALWLRRRGFSVSLEAKW